MRRFLPLVTLTIACCHTDNGPKCFPDQCEQVKQLSVSVPERICIQPFSKIASFNRDNIPDGVQVIVRPIDHYGDPVKAGGLWYFELWTYVEASQERKGERIAFWERMIESHDDIRTYWTRSQMYQFDLAWTEQIEKMKPEHYYVLTATYRTPWNTTLHDERVLEFHLSRQFVTDTTPAE